MTLKTQNRAKASGFLDNYETSPNYLSVADPKHGKPGILEATSPNGNRVLIRIWPRKTKDDSDLKDIWQHELRQLHRLGGYPGAQNYIARLIDAGSDASGFYIVLDVGQRRPLETILSRGRGATDWLRALNLPANRFRLWSNLRRIASGLQILHNEGLVHRNLDGYAVLTSAGADPDFQLTGFEWSLRLTATIDRPSASKAPSVPSISFAGDWAAFAILVARVFNISPTRLSDHSIADYDVHESASAAEVRLIRDLSLANKLNRLDGELVTRRIDEILGQIDASKSGEDGRYHLVLRLDSESSLSMAIREASNLAIEMDDVASQYVWLEADLGDTVRILTVGNGDEAQLYLRGRELVYRLKPYRVKDDVTWQFAFCESAEPTKSWRRNPSADDELPSAAIKFVALSEARQSYNRNRGRVPSWADRIKSMLPSESSGGSRTEQLHRAFTLLHAVEIAFAAATAFPVTVGKVEKTAGIVELKFRPSRDREILAEALGLAPPLQRLREGLEMERLGEGEGWTLTEAANLGQSQSGDIDLTFEDDTSDNDDAEPVFRFRTLGQAPILIREGYLVPSGSRGDFVQFRRRSKAIRLLKEHTELLQNLADPRGRLVPTHDFVEEDDGYNELDAAKQVSLKQLTAILPTYLLQGPPGVGKTFLIRDLVRRRLEDDTSGRMLITAQGNHAIDHLLDELADMWGKAPDKAPLAVRCRPKDDHAIPGPYDLSDRSSDLIVGLANTLLAESASPTVKARLRALAGTDTSVDSSRVSTERRSVEGLVMRAANLVFATTNSADLERLVEERGQFDWTVVEEAGKATGCELVAPLMLSHRRLLIGDHKQLPPFGAKELEDLLNDANSVREALKTLPKLVDRTVRNLFDEDLLEFLEDDSQDIEALCTGAKRVLYLFETALRAELERQEKKGGGRPIASTLKVQHRMHPVICELVSKCFYGDLTTSEKREAEAVEQAAWIKSKNPLILPDSPLVFVNMPYERSAYGKGRIEQLPRFTNVDEVKEIVALVAQLTVTSLAKKKPSLVILAPYARQVRRLKDAILGDPAASKALASFKPVARGNEWCSTVDAFQGNEADVVLFSLVRNNRGATIRKALGFVGDQRRFNVLLSRAKQRLVFVGSRQFLETIASPLGLEADPSSEFLRRFLSTFSDLIKLNKAALSDRCEPIKASR